MTSITARSVMMRSTTFLPVSGSLHRSRILGAPPLAACSMATMTRFAPVTRSIAPPMPFNTLPGMVQLAMSPCSLTSIAPRMARSMWPPRIIPKESALEKKAVPLISVTVSLPALMRSGSSSASVGYGPMPSIPFSLWKMTSIPFGR